MDNNIVSSDYKKSSNTELDDLVIEKLQHYADLLEKQVNRKKFGCINGIHNQTKIIGIDF